MCLNIYPSRHNLLLYIQKRWRMKCLSTFNPKKYFQICDGRLNIIIKINIDSVLQSHYYKLRKNKFEFKGKNEKHVGQFSSRRTSVFKIHLAPELLSVNEFVVDTKYSRTCTGHITIHWQNEIFFFAVNEKVFLCENMWWTGLVFPWYIIGFISLTIIIWSFFIHEKQWVRPLKLVWCCFSHCTIWRKQWTFGHSKCNKGNMLLICKMIDH